MATETDTAAQIASLEQQVYELNQQLAALQKTHPGTEVPNYTFSTQSGEVTLADLFAEKAQLLVIHNMGQGCRYCTLWADGFNGFVPHLESALSVVLVSKDPPEVQRQFANARGWHFRLASHGGGDYIREQTVQPGTDNMPGVVLYERRGDSILRRNSAVFGPGDRYCSMWSLLGGSAGIVTPALSRSSLPLAATSSSMKDCSYSQSLPAGISTDTGSSKACRSIRAISLLNALACLCETSVGYMLVNVGEKPARSNQLRVISCLGQLPARVPPQK